MFKNYGIILTGFLSFLGVECGFLKPETEKEVIARVNDSYLYSDEIAPLIGENTSKEDSAFFVSNYINRWATQKLLIDRAKVNLGSRQQQEFEKLVENYRSELYAKAYSDAIIARQLDTTIPMEDIETFYRENGSNFKLSEDLVKVRYIRLAQEHSGLQDIREKFRRFDENDREDLLDMAIHFYSYSLNDSVWVKTRQVYQKIEPLNMESDKELLKKGNFMQLKDSLEVYLISVEDVKLAGEQAPLDFSLPTIKQILLNRRKLDLIKKLEKDITRDAIKNKKFEIYH